MNAVILSSDKKIFDRAHDSFARMREYASLVERLDVIVFDAAGKTLHDGPLAAQGLPSGGKWLQPFYCLAAAWRICRAKKVGVVITQDPIFYGLCGYAISRLTGAKLLASAYGTNIFNREWRNESLSNRLRFHLGKFVLKSADAVQADGFEDVADLKARLGDKVFWKPIVPSNIGEFQKIERRQNDGIFRALFVGRLVKQKNIPFLIDIIKSAIQRLPAGKIRFTIIGDGPLRSYLEGRLKSEGLSDFVEYRPECSRQEIIGFYAAHDALILSSYYEGFAKVMMEAASSGVPIVTTKVSGVDNIIRNGENSYVVAQGDLQGFVDRLIGLAGNAELRNEFSRRLRAGFVSRYSADLTISIQKNIFDYLSRPKLLILTQVLDFDHPILGFFHRWVEEFAKNCSSVTVICLSEGKHHLPDNVRVISLGKEKNPSRLAYLWKFYSAIWRERKNYDAVFVHMNQIYVLLGSWFWKLLGKPVGLWYAHGMVAWDLKLAAKLTDHVFTSTPEGCRISSDKIRVVGQGIDTDYFVPDKEKGTNDGRFRLITVGRISPVKDYEILIRAAVLLKEKDFNFQMQIIGGPGNAEQEKYLDHLRKLVKESGLSEQVNFLGPLPQSEIISHLQSADAFVNASRTGSLDKAILEAMACGLPVLTCNESLVGVLGEHAERLMFQAGDAAELAGKLMALQSSAEECRQLGAALRLIVEQNHNLRGLIIKIMNHFKV